MEWKEKIKMWCARGERSLHDTNEKMIRLGATREEADKYLKTLENKGFVSEHRFVSAFIHDHLVLKNWGPLKIRFALKKKGCSSSLIDSELAKFSDLAIDKALKNTISTRFTIYPDEHKTHRERLIRYLQNRGYTLDNILTALNML